VNGILKESMICERMSVCDGLMLIVIMMNVGIIVVRCWIVIGILCCMNFCIMICLESVLMVEFESLDVISVSVKSMFEVLLRIGSSVLCVFLSELMFVRLVL